MNKKIEKSLEYIAYALGRIANTLEVQNKPKGLGVPNRLFGTTDCVSKEEIPLPTPWNSGYVPSCDNDILKNQIMD
ncbi:MAG: hypothetical protein EBQ92_01490 [Proteobacteria bacterium]|nr:hypothetical protein [Pseudomonadota bacterium]